MSDTYPNLRRCDLYGHWVFARSDPPSEVQVERSRAGLLRQLKTDYLVPVGAIETHYSTAPSIDRAGILLSETRAAGLPPEQRLPQGWRRWFKAP